MAGETRPGAVHGGTVPRGLRTAEAADGSGGRFGRMFPDLSPVALDDRAIDALVRILRRPDVPENHDVPAGYTYVGQFVDHDITFDPSSLQQKDDDPAAHVNFRTPRLDLDSVYGSGPLGQPYLYEWNGAQRDQGVKLLVTLRDPKGPKPFFDLPRNAEGRALTGDPRNDENLILAQLHLLFLHFHNRVVDDLRDEHPRLHGAALFSEARRLVRWHYQWMVVHDFLPKIVGEDTMRSLVATAPADRRLRWEGDPWIPAEFSGAAYRFGHSMVRPIYTVTADEVDVPIFALRSDPRRSLRGLRPLPPEFVIEWHRFFALGGSGLQSSMAIDTVISRRLFELPPDVGTDGMAELPRMNLLRAAQLELPAGPDVARAMGHERLDAAQLMLDDAPIDDDIREALLAGAPLWYYVLCEAAALRGGRCLGPVGGGIVGEVLLGLIEADPSSYMHAPSPWTPRLGSDGDFTMPDLVRYAAPPPRPAA
jgi:hypothetical protein